MRKTFQLCNLDCASCSDKLERAISKLPGIQSANINFVTQKLTLEADEDVFDDLMVRVQRTVNRAVKGCILQ